MNIKAIVFDYGKVICLPPDPEIIELLAERAGVEKNKFETTLWTLRSEYDRGTLNSKEYYKKVLGSLEVDLDDTSIDEMIEMDLASWKHINTGTVALMEDVKKAGYILGILSNMPHDFLAWARKNNPVFSLPHKSLFSCEVGLLKPEPAIYRELLSLLSVESEEVVFFDDNEENVKGAADLGIRAFLWKSPEEARTELRSLGIRL